MTVLLDAGVLVAASFQDHVHNPAADDWLDGLDDSYATCPITQGALIRQSVRTGRSVADALHLLSLITEADRHEFWPDQLGYEHISMKGVIGHRQVTDAYLAALARDRHGQVATLDRGFAALHPDVAELVPTP